MAKKRRPSTASSRSRGKRSSGAVVASTSKRKASLSSVKKSAPTKKGGGTAATRRIVSSKTKRAPIDENEENLYGTHGGEGLESTSDSSVHDQDVGSSSDEEDDIRDHVAGTRNLAAAAAAGATKNKKRKAESFSSSSSGDDEDESEDSDSVESDDNEDDNGRKGKISNKFFSDENADWLKPKIRTAQKQQLIPSSGEDSDDDDDDEFAGRGGLDGDDSDSSEASDELLEVERQSRLIDREMELEEAEAEEEYRRTIAQQTAVFHLPTPEELEDDEDRVVPPTELRERIDAILEVLADFKSRREPERSRSEYVDQLQSDMAELFGYLPELVEHFLSMFGPAETLEFLTASDSPRPLVIRTNTLKARRKDLAAALLKRGVTLDPLASWSKVGLKISESPIPIGATPEYLAGHYMLQSAASLCPVMALSPQQNERVLDMSAAPGGKTSYLSQLMRNTGTIVANDLKPDRQKATVANMHRLGVRNVITCTYDGRKLGKLWPNKFDRVLLDAPCSGLGVISRDPSVKVQRTMADVHRTVVLQKEILLSAIDALSYKKGGGYIVYSTCSVSVAENEEVVNYVLGKRDVKIVDSGLDFGKPGFTRYQQKRFHPSLALTRRFYPHVHNFDGFYVAKLKKLSDKRPSDDAQISSSTTEKETIFAAEIESGEVGKSIEDTANTKSQGDEKINAKMNTKMEVSKKRDASAAAAASNESTTKKAKKGKGTSVPPSRFMTQEQKKKKKKQTTNAKVTKPRRHKLGI